MGRTVSTTFAKKMKLFSDFLIFGAFEGKSRRSKQVEVITKPINIYFC
jgi:hypothetical protein